MACILQIKFGTCLKNRNPYNTMSLKTRLMESMKIIRSFGVGCLITIMLSSLTYSIEHFQTGFNFSLGYPQNEFKDKVGGDGWGGSAYITYKLPKTILSVGTSFCLLVYGSDTREEPFSPAIPEIMVNVTTRNYILMCHFLLRVQPPEGKIRPYFDGYFGFNYLWTETGVYNRRGINEEITSNVNFSDSTFSYGVGSGLLLRVCGRKSGSFATYIDLGIRYLKGGKAEYLKEGSILIENANVIYDVSKSNTDLFTAHLGVSFSF